MNVKMPDNPFPKRAKSDAKSSALDELVKPLRLLTTEVAELMEKYHLKSADIDLDGITTGKIHLQTSKTNGVTLYLKGDVVNGKGAIAGTPYIAHYTGEFFWRPTPDSEDFVKDGDFVKNGQLIGWAMGESKDMSFGIRADQDGIIHMMAQNASKVAEGETLLYYIEAQ